MVQVFTWIRFSVGATINTMIAAVKAMAVRLLKMQPENLKLLM